MDSRNGAAGGEPAQRDTDARDKLRKRGEKMARAFGLPFLAVATTGEAVQCARELLGQAGPRGFNVD